MRDISCHSAVLFVSAFSEADNATIRHPWRFDWLNETGVLIWEVRPINQDKYPQCECWLCVQCNAVIGRQWSADYDKHRCALWIAWVFWNRRFGGLRKAQ